MKNPILKAFLSDKTIITYRKEFKSIEQLARRMEETEDKKYMYAIMAEIKNLMSDFQKKLISNIYPILYIIFADQKLNEGQWYGIKMKCYNGLKFGFVRSMLSMKMYLESLTELIQDQKLQEKYLYNFYLKATDREKQTFEKIKNEYFKNKKMPDF